MRYNARKKVSVYTVEPTYGDYGEMSLSRTLIYSGTELVCPMTSKIVLKDYGIKTTQPKKVIFSKELPTSEDEVLSLTIDGKNYSVLERTDFDKFNILLVDIEKGINYGE
jgi:hypothetical protein